MSEISQKVFIVVPKGHSGRQSEKPPVIERGGDVKTSKYLDTFSGCYP